MAPAAQAKLTYEDYLLLPDDGQRHEIIDGEHYVNPAPSSRHQETVMNLILILAVYVRKNRLGRVYVAPYDVVLSTVDVLQPDVMFISNEREELITKANLQGAPNLVIEVLSPSTRIVDATLKLQRYDRFGVDEYWLIDPDDQSVTIYRRRDARLEREESGDIIQSPILPGLAIATSDIFAE
jgi:Uma2 family endonuclease